jgi:CheY-like chemotaxis protein
MTVKVLTVLLAEDEESDAMILKTAFKLAVDAHRMVTVPDGQELVEYLSGDGRYSDRSLFPLPALIILDLKMPRMNGFDVLAWLQTKPDLQVIPAVVLSSSPSELDVNRARQLGAREYFTKPFGFNEVVKLVRQIQTKWLPSAPTPETESTVEAPSSE